MKILVQCPGSFSAGLDSPERGEGRWAQNFARMLAMAGHDVYAGSGWWHLGVQKEHYGVKLLDQSKVNEHEPYDIYIDSAWWQDKVPGAKANKYIILKWSLENYTRNIPLLDNYYLAYPYPSKHWEFTKSLNSQKTFALPTMFGTDFKAPNWDKTKIFLPGKIDLNRDYHRFLPAITNILNQYPVEGGSMDWFKQQFAGKVNFDLPGSNWFNTIPYNSILVSLSKCKLSLPILNPGCIIESTFQGVPSIFWEHGGFFNDLGSMLDILIPHNASPEQFLEMFNLLMNNKKKYQEVVKGSQDFFLPYTYRGSLGYFNLMLEHIF